MTIKKAFKLDIKADDVSDAGTFVGYGSVFGNRDLGGDVVESGAFKRSLKENGIPALLWQLDTRNPIGIYKEVTEDRSGLKVRGELNLETTQGREAHALLKQGALGGLSIGYSIKESHYDRKTNTHHLQDLDLFEISLVTMPMNPQATVSGVKDLTALPLAENDYVWDERAALKRVEEFEGAELSKCSLYSSDSECDLLITDVVDGELMVIPQAVVAANNLLGKFDIPEAKKKEIKNVINDYLSKAGISPSTGKMTVREFEGFLRDVGGFSKAEAATIAGKGFKSLQVTESTPRDASGTSDIVAYLENFNKQLKGKDNE